VFKRNIRGREFSGSTTLSGDKIMKNILLSLLALAPMAEANQMQFDVFSEKYSGWELYLENDLVKISVEMKNHYYLQDDGLDWIFEGEDPTGEIRQDNKASFEGFSYWEIRTYIGDGKLVTPRLGDESYQDTLKRHKDFVFENTGRIGWNNPDEQNYQCQREGGCPATINDDGNIQRVVFRKGDIVDTDGGWIINPKQGWKKVMEEVGGNREDASLDPQPEPIEDEL
jgi:hypothetical protein